MLPPLFLQRMAALLGDEYAAFLASYDAAPATGLRVNTLKIAVEAFRGVAPFALTPVPWCPAGFIVSRDAEPGKHPWHAAGLYYLQEPSAMAVAGLLDPQPGERVLDLAAAPGGKATHIASLMADEGLLIANEPHPQRAWTLAENLERWGAANVAITNETPERLADRFAGFFDRVLLDAPCSGEGMFRKSEAARREWSPALVQGCAQRQSLILEQAARLVRPGGRLVYATCTFAPEEDEGVIARFLDAHSDFALVPAPPRPGFAAGRPDWIGRVSASGSADLAAAVRLWPHTGPGEGHFIAVLRRRSDADVPASQPKPWRHAALPRPVERAYQEFCAQNLASAAAAERLALVGAYLYALPPGLPDLTGLRFLHPGRWLGTLKKGRFEPSHALALCLRPADALRCADLPADSPELHAYLRGESFRSAGEDGWTLIAADGFAVGWGKRVAGVMKSHYPRGLRWN
ncbi:MAG: RsmB/NOP family class I SAM-dependent RNA methyltransferase [Anaerolineae bacterium]